MSAKIGSMPGPLDPVFIARMACAEYAEIGPLRASPNDVPGEGRAGRPGARLLAEAAEGNRVFRTA
jgi:hypothetical protein